MNRLSRKVEHYVAKLIANCFMVALLLLSIGAVIWSIKWVLSLLGVM